MRWRRLGAAVVLAALAAAAGMGLLRSTLGGADGDPVWEIAARLRCPACAGESVADSRSPIAAAMRQAAADQVAQGRNRDEIERWFVQRYGQDVLAGPSFRGAGLLLWSVPALALLGACVAAVRTVRPRFGPWTHVRPGRPEPGGDEGQDRSARRAWWVTSVGLVGVVAAVALTAARPAPESGAESTDPAATAVFLARDLEQQNRYAAAADLYRQPLQARPDDQIRLRLAFALLRSGNAAAAAEMARQVLTVTPDSPDGLLVLGLAQRKTSPAEARITLRRFLAAAPDHPAAAEIRRLAGS